MRNQTAYMRCAPSSSRTRSPGHISSKRRCQSKRQQFLPRCSLALNPTPDLVLAPPSFRPRPRGRPTSCVVLPAQLLISRLPLPLRTQDRSGGKGALPAHAHGARTPLRCSARKMRFDGRQSKRGVTIDGPMGRSKYRGTRGNVSTYGSGQKRTP